MTRKFRFLGYGNRILFDGDYRNMDLSKHYWYNIVQLTVGKIYEAKNFSHYNGEVPEEAQFLDDDGCQYYQELRFFVEVFDAPEFPENWDEGLELPTEDELIVMNINAKSLEADFGVS